MKKKWMENETIQEGIRQLQLGMRELELLFDKIEAQFDTLGEKLEECISELEHILETGESMGEGLKEKILDCEELTGSPKCDLESSVHQRFWDIHRELPWWISNDLTIEDVLGEEDLERLETLKARAEKLDEKVRESAWWERRGRFMSLYRDYMNREDKKNIKKMLLEDNQDEFVFAETIVNRLYDVEIHGPIPSGLLKISKAYWLGLRKGTVWMPTKDNYVLDDKNPENNRNVRCVYNIKFTPEEECTPEQRKEIEQRRLKLAELRSKINSGEGDYDKPGKIILPLYNVPYMFDSMTTVVGDGRTVRGTTGVTERTEFREIEVTQKELIEAGILLEDLEQLGITWKSLEEIEKDGYKYSTQTIITREEIADLDREQALATVEVKVGGVLRFIKEKLSKLKEKITGKGKGEQGEGEER